MVNEVRNEGGRPGRRERLLLLLAVLCIGIVWSLYRFSVAREWEAISFRSEFALTAQNRILAIHREIDGNLTALNVLRGLAETPHGFDRASFDGFAARILESHPSLRALEWVARVPHTERRWFEEALRRDGAPYPQITEGELGANRRTARREEYYPVRYLFPHNAANGSAIGYDLGTVPAWRTGLMWAAQTGQVAALAKFKIVEHTGDGYAVAAMLPVYAKGAAPPTAGAQPLISGFAMLLLQVGDVVERALENLDRQEIDIQIYDQSAQKGRKLLYFHASHRSNPADGTAAPLPENQAQHPDRGRYSRTLWVGGREWLIVCTPSPAMVRAGKTWRPWAILAMGMLITLVAGAYCLLHGMYRARMAALVRELTGANQRLNQEIAVRTKAENDLALARDEALDASRLKSQFLAVMSHEIRTPMNGVIGMAGLMMGTPLTAEQREYTETMRQSGEALVTLIDDILDLSRIEAGRIRLRHERFDLRAVTDGITGMLSAQARAKGIVVSVDFPRDISGQMTGDAGRVRQVLTNLIGNALKFTDRGEVRVTVKRGAELQREQLRIEVRDTGPGIAQEALGLLFLRFSQLDSSTTRQHGGTGLGLAISKELVNLMGGEIGVESSVGEGSTFWFTLPAPPEVQPARHGASKKERSSVEGMFEGSSLRVLIAEDNVVNQKVASRMLQKLGLATDVASNGRVAVELFAQLPYDLIFMDCHMPEMDGYEATREIRSLQPPGQRTVIIAMTAEAMDGSREHCLAAGMDDYLAKPVRLPEVVEALRKFVPVIEPASSLGD